MTTLSIVLFILTTIEPASQSVWQRASDYPKTYKRVSIRSAPIRYWHHRGLETDQPLSGSARKQWVVDELKEHAQENLEAGYPGLDRAHHR
ncbi:MAG: hypothetical protein ACYC0V_00175 [Armatimonadota bacterium]